MVTEYTPDVIDEHKVKKAGKIWGLGDIRLYECPLTYITAETNEIASQCYRTEDSKRLLFQGEWAEQPYWFIEAVDIHKAEQARRAEKHGNKKT